MAAATPPPEPSESRRLRRWVMGVALAALLGAGAGGFATWVGHRSAIRQVHLERARMAAMALVGMHRWNAAQGGVCIQTSPAAAHSPYLASPAITDTAGRTYGKTDPPALARGLSGSGLTHHLTSLKPLNPANGPDLDETRALLAFQGGAQEWSWIRASDRETLFHHMVPLKVESSCLPCHGQQGYRTGELRGGLSLAFRIQDPETPPTTRLAILAAFALTAAAILAAVLVWVHRRMAARVQSIQLQLQAQTTTDALTGVMNRRAILQRLEEEMERHRRSGKPLGCILLDMDHFKLLNARFGQTAGDEVLRRIGGHLEEALRPYDRVGRMEGEAFLVVLPDCDRETLRGVAERLRARIPDAFPIGSAEAPFAVTASFGITLFRVGESLQALLDRTDRGMLVAKGLGRNRVEEDVV